MLAREHNGLVRSKGLFVMQPILTVLMLWTADFNTTTMDNYTPDQL